MKKYEALGMTKEEYKTMIDTKAKINNYKCSIKYAEEAIKQMLEQIEIKKQKIAEWQEKIASAEEALADQTNHLICLLKRLKKYDKI